MKAILYARVSTKEQGKSGLGLEAQIDDMKRFCDYHKIEILDVRTEVVSGGYPLDRRPILKQSLSDASKAKAVVLTSKIDRLSRNASFILNLMEAKVGFMVVECGINVSPLEIQLRASFAEEERRKISGRIKAAFKAKKDREEPMGFRLAKQAYQQAKMIPLAAAAKKQEADSFAIHMKPTISRMQRDGMTLSQIAEELNLHGFSTATGKGKWYAQSVKNIVSRWN